MSELRLEIDGFKMYLSGTWLQISNDYGVQEALDIAVKEDETTKEKAVKYFTDFIFNHTFRDCKGSINRVVYVKELKKYYQLQTVYDEGFKYIRKYDDKLVYVDEELIDKRYPHEVNEWIYERYKDGVISALIVNVLRNERMGDCSRHGITEDRDTLYLIGTGMNIPTDIRTCVELEAMEVSGKECLSAKPLYHRRRWYSFGGTFIHTSDTRYEEFTGLSYPIPVHDRYEGR